MAPRKKALAVKESSENISPMHPCNQLETLGAIQQELSNQRDADNRIETALEKLVADNVAERQNTAKMFGKVEVELARFTCAMESSAKTNEQQVQNQTAMLKELGNLSKMTALMQQNQEVVHNQMKNHIAESAQWRDDIEKRVGKLERTKWLWYTIGVGIVGLICVLSYLATIWGVFGGHK